VGRNLILLSDLHPGHPGGRRHSLGGRPFPSPAAVIDLPRTNVSLQGCAQGIGDVSIQVQLLAVWAWVENMRQFHLARIVMRFDRHFFPGGGAERGWAKGQRPNLDFLGSIELDPAIPPPGVDHGVDHRPGFFF